MSTTFKFGNVPGAVSTLKDTVVLNGSQTWCDALGADPTVYWICNSGVTVFQPFMQFNVDYIRQNYTDASVISAMLHLFVTVDPIYTPVLGNTISIKRVTVPWGVDSLSAGRTVKNEYLTVGTGPYPVPGAATMLASLHYSDTNKVLWPGNSPALSVDDSTAWATKANTDPTSFTNGEDLIFDVGSLVQGWVAGTFPNYGLSFEMPIGQTHARGNQISVYSNEQTDSTGYYPYLEVTFDGTLQTPTVTPFSIY